MNIKKKHQTFRRALMLSSALLFPVTMLYFSPGIVFRGARLGILSGSYFTFAILCISSIFFGRAWCGWLCPGAGLQELSRTVNNKEFTRTKLKLLKYIVWCLWLIGIALVAIFIGGGFKSIDLFLGTDHGVSIHNLPLLGFYYVVIGSILAFSLIFGRRGFCHGLCWMAPFMVIGRNFRNKLKIPALQLYAQPELCIKCKKCTTVCPMSLPVMDLVDNIMIEQTDCILCGACIDACPKGVLSISILKPSGLKK